MADSPTKPAPGSTGDAPDPGATESAPSAGGRGADDTGAAGRGVIYIALAKIYFMVAGALLELRLPTVLGNVVYGSYGVVNSLVSPLNNVLVTGTIQTVSRFASQRPEAARAVQRAGLRLHLYFGLVLAIGFAAFSPITARIFSDASKTTPLMVAALIVAAYSFYAVFVGTANGRREFHKQAGLDIAFATLRVGGILGLAMAGFGLLGAMSGWAAAACVILIVSSFAVGLPGRARAGDPAVPLRPLVSFFVSVSIYLVLLNLIMVADQLLLAALSAKWFAAHGDDALATLRASMTDGFLPDFTSIAPAAAADGQVGYYRAVQTLARLSYQAIIAATFVVFPLVSRSTFENDRAATARYVHTTTRYSLVFASAIAVVLAANPAEMLDLPFPTDYATTGWAALVALALGNVAFSVFAIVGTILNGAGFTREAIAVAGATLVVAAVANALVIPRFVPGQALLTACATATALSMLLGAAAGGLLLKRKVGAFLPLASLIRVALAAAAAVGFGRLVSLGGAIGTLVEAAAVGLVFVIVLIATREFRRADLDALRRVLRRRKGGNS